MIAEVVRYEQQDSVFIGEVDTNRWLEAILKFQYST